MLSRIRNSYNHTIYASFTSFIVQAIINNFLPLLFITFQSKYNISFDRIVVLISFNFITQLLVDILAIKLADKIGYRICIVAAHIFAGVGLISLAVLPGLFSDPLIGLIISVMLYAVGGGLIEVIASPIVEACPTDNKEGAMSLLHSFYCWGQAGVVLFSTLFFVIFGIDHWRYVALIWAMIPLANAIYFSLVPINTLHGDEEPIKVRKFAGNRIFWLMILLMFCAGACELSISQWASAFAEAGLGVTKTIGDLAGPCTFAVLMGISRVFFAKHSEKLDLKNYMLICAGLCLISYLLASLSTSAIIGLLGCALCGFAVGIMWPGTYSLSAAGIKGGSTSMFALLALAGDLGCFAGPSVVGAVTGAVGGNMKMGILAAAIFPVIMIIGLFIFKSALRKQA